ncbi:MAG: hypothetical protein N0C90_26305 [Candidatus Thiodiazotropha endolucinida]|nr:hypothetical protein [Candidatus Thiodiazotropha taylori]MCW4264861.1 hypothetical protein [Candidatus Thiodiazotropha endolucinida]
MLDVEHETVHEDISDFDDISDVDVEVDAYNGDDYFNGSVNSDKGDGMSDGTEVIVISSDDDDNDDTAVEISEMRVRTQTFVLTFQKQTKYIGNQAIQTVHQLSETTMNIMTSTSEDCFSPGGSVAICVLIAFCRFS